MKTAARKHAGESREGSEQNERLLRGGEEKKISPGRLKGIREGQREGVCVKECA